ncbi:MAG: hypothetical protein H7645_09470 [Candidatus Heimdallarchaeota archaeon]|nr:hypothetical protein [Candidatus Heimdallarchaeota archaeon]MCK4770555.1 hypothetical protein [Candidatus Heimdallarchaeota archaeon]
MFDEINKDWMDNYEITYQKYKPQWDYHYQRVRRFLKSCLSDRIKTLGFIGVTSKIPEIDLDILDKIDEITLLDIYEEGMLKAKEHLKSTLEYEKVHLKILDITQGFTDAIVIYFQEYDNGNLSEDELFQNLEYPDFTYKEYDGSKYDFIAHMGLMDYYFMPLFTQFCHKLLHRYDNFFERMKKLNDQAVKISLQAINSMLSEDGHLVLSSPVTRIPEGEKCSRSLFWLKNLEVHLKDTGFVIEKESRHNWDEFPEKNGHSHGILNVYCKKRRN